MKLTNNIFDLENLDLLTSEEKLFNKTHIEKLMAYSEGKVDGVQIKALTAGAATIAKRQQSRSAVALLMWNVEKLKEKNIMIENSNNGQ
ncbi:MAG: hypothetical protein ACTSYW_00560 [Candidatus Heimdallarchaeota archaeon]